MNYYLYVHENPNAPRRSNGLKFYGYPTRRKPIQVIVIHTAENIPDIVPPDTGAENVANYFANTSRPASAHTVTDTDSTIRLLPDDATAFHVIGYNSQAWGLEIATQAAKWDRLPLEYKNRLLIRAAQEAARVATKYDIPVVFRTKSQIDAGQTGFTGHTNLDPARRSDPGFDLGDWSRFLGLVRHYQTGDDVAQFTDDEVAELKAMVRSLKQLDPPSNGGFAGPAADLVRRERSLPLHDPVPAGVDGVPYGTPIKIVPAD